MITLSELGTKMVRTCWHYVHLCRDDTDDAKVRQRTTYQATWERQKLQHIEQPFTVRSIIVSSEFAVHAAWLPITYNN